MTNKRIKKKYLPYLQSLFETKDVKVTKRGLATCLRIFSSKKRPSFIIHDGDLSDAIFENHEPNGKYHAEDCNRNNPNNFIYYYKKRFYLKHKSKIAHCYYNNKRN